MPRSAASAPILGAPISWNLETNPAGAAGEHRTPVRVVVAGRTNRLTPAGLAAMLTAVAGYYTPAKCQQLARLDGGDLSVIVRAGEVVMDVLGADVPTVASSIQGVLSVAANTTTGA